MPAPAEPVLEVSDIQGHISPGFGSAFSAVLGFRLDDDAAGRAALADLVPEVTTMADSLREKEVRRAAFRAEAVPADQLFPSLAVSFSADLLRRWGCNVNNLDFAFREGMLRDAEALGDPVDDAKLPVDWTCGRDDETRLDLLLVVGHSTGEERDHSISRWCERLSPQWYPVLIERGGRRDGDKEFFGFADGVSQPDIRGTNSDGAPVNRRVIAADDPRSLVFSRPGQRLVWPGNFIFGYPGEVSASPLMAGPTIEPPQPWMRNGSYLVFRRLLQDVDAFRAAIAAAEEYARGLGHELGEGWLASRFVGRWPDGTPLHVSPNEPVPDLGNDRNRNNNFLFARALRETRIFDYLGNETVLPAVPQDALGVHLPRVSHIRKVNPRDGVSEIGAEKHPGTLMLRRGIAFGPDYEDAPGEDRGLLFLSYQTSIMNQFRFVQRNWANSEQLPVTDGRDPIIGQDGSTSPARTLKLKGPSGRSLACPFNGRWVVATAGEYFFAPSISALRDLIAA